MLIARIEVSRADRRGATETNCERITAIDGWDVLGYHGCGREEHSGENAPADPPDWLAELADNELAEV